MTNLIKGVGKYADGILTIITEDTLYDFCLVTHEYGYRTLGDYWNCGGKVTLEALEELKADCDKFYVFGLDTFEVLESRKLK